MNLDQENIQKIVDEIHGTNRNNNNVKVENLNVNDTPPMITKSNTKLGSNHQHVPRPPSSGANITGISGITTLSMSVNNTNINTNSINTVIAQAPLIHATSRTAQSAQSGQADSLHLNMKQEDQ